MASKDPRRALVEGRGIALREDDVDTDRIIPARYMKGVTFEGLGEHAFQDARFDEAGEPKAHPFNDARFKGASILVVNRNFGCGSSREHAPQALARAGIAALVGESFAEIFSGNCVSLGIPPARVSAADARAIQDQVEADPELTLVVDLAKGQLRAGSKLYAISMPETQRQALVAGTWDSTGALLAAEAAIAKTAASLPYMTWKAAG
ncbi:MAG TPA: 3-isopropylmalate dehydratase small subunit [Rectinemataceae bacterium]|nr:3-isopropylmalate dehydratase small subunit [Rectinemataceae bacterium]